jgi:F0F1-type ATP synthase membrane subunit b/b'
VRRFAPLFPAGLLGTAMLLAGPPALAASEASEASPLTPYFQWINFAIVAGALGWLLVKKAPAFFSARATEIAAGLNEGARLKEEAEAKRREAEGRLANLAGELEELRAASRRDAVAESGRIQAATREEAGKIDRAAQAEVEAAARSARQELRALAAKLSIERAEAVLRAELTPAAEDGILSTFLGELSLAGGKAGRLN